MISETNIENYISSNRQNAFNALRLKSEPKEIFVYVEDIDDVAFWHGILNPYEKQASIKFRIRTPVSTATTGKEKLKSLFSEIGLDLIICLDSDYDYLLPENSNNAKIINQSPYIFQTYTYAMENLKCYAENLNNLCITATHNSMDDIIDFSQFLSEYSKIIYPLFIWNLYFYHIKEPNKFPISDFSRLITIGNFNPDNYQTLLNTLQASITEKLQEFDSDIDINEFAEQFSELDDTNTYLFVSGHALYPTVLNFLKEVCKKLEQNHIEQIKQLARTEKEYKEKRKHYKDSTTPVEALLKSNGKFLNCFLFKKIKTDIENYLELFKQKNQGLKHV